MNEKIPYKKTLRCNNKGMVTDPNNYIDKVKYKSFNPSMPACVRGTDR
jgi:hypothetical protein